MDIILVVGFTSVLIIVFAVIMCTAIAMMDDEERN